MKRISLLIITALVIFCFGFAGTSHATLLSDYFGVTLTKGFVTGYGSNQFTNTWAPTKHTATADYAVDNYKCWNTGSGYVAGNAPSGGEIFDVEALYFDDTPSRINIAIVTSFPSTGKWWPTNDPLDLVIPGDIALDLGGGAYDYGINVADITGTSGGYVTNFALGNGEVYNTDSGDWFIGNPLSAVSETELTNFSGGTYQGLASYFAYYNYGLNENGSTTYVIEASIHRSLLGELSKGDLIGMMWQTGCANDWVAGLFDLDADIDHPYNPIPEPTTMVLFGIGLAGAAIARKKR